MKPNLFQYATSELSQDAMLCWLLAWAKPECRDANHALNQVGYSFLQSIFEKAKKEIPTELTSIKVTRQTYDIDVLCIVNGDTAIIIEDKTATQEHSNQLRKYREEVKKRKLLPEQMIPVYVQTGDQSDYSNVGNNGYHVLMRSDLLSMLESEESQKARKTSDILDDFAVRLRQIEDDVQSYKSKPLKDWSDNAWKGFYIKLQAEHMKDGRWKKVSNPSKGFIGFWWYFQHVENCQIYLQLEEARFCFKIIPHKGVDRIQVAKQWSHQIIKAAPQYGLKAVRPSRLRAGDYMTVAQLQGEYRKQTSDNILDLDATLTVLRSAQDVVEACASKTNIDSCDEVL